MKIVTGTEMQMLDRRTITEAHVPSTVLMERAGEGIVRHLEEHYGPARGKTITILCHRVNRIRNGDFTFPRSQGCVQCALQNNPLPAASWQFDSLVAIRPHPAPGWRQENRRVGDGWRGLRNKP